MMVMNSTCIGGCLDDAQSPIEKRRVRLNQWAEADKEFLRLLSIIYKEQKQKEGETSSSSSPSSSSSSSSYPSDSPARLPTDCDQSYHCRQRYLRSYTFRRRQTAAQRTKKWLIKELKKLCSSSSNNNSSNKNLSARGSCFFRESVFEFLFLCVAKVDVHET